MAVKVSNGTDTFEVEESNLSKAQADGFVPTIKVSNGKVEHDVHPSMLSEAEKDGFNPLKPERSALEVTRDALDVTNWPKNIAAGLHKVDEYTGAPIRKFVTEAITGDKLDHAPSGAEQAKRMGATDITYGEAFGVPSYLGGNISPADIYGAALEMAQDPVVIGSAAKKGVQALAKSAAPAIEGLSAKQFLRAGQTQAAEATAEAAAKSGASISGGGLTVEQGGKLFEVKAPQSLDELRNWKPASNAGELPGKARLSQIEQTIPDLQTKPLKYHYDMMENPKAMKELKLQFENLPSSDSKKIAAYNQQIVDEAGAKVKETVKGITPNEVRSISESGDDFINAAKEKYHSEKEALAPVFEELKKAPPISRDETMDLARAIGENTKIGKLMDVDAEGKLFLNKNTPRSGVSDAEHNVLSRVISDMNEGMTFKEIQDTRDFLRKSMDATNPSATAEIGKVRSIMLGQLEAMAEKTGGNVGETFKRYAINERSRESIEKVIGGKIESLDSMFAANPDRVVQKIFSNPNYAKVVGDYVGPEKMQDLIASYINNGTKGAFDQATGFNPSKLRTWIKSNDTFLTQYAPEVKERLSALADYGYFGKRFLDEVNPSGTAASLLSAIEPKGFFQKVAKDGVTAAVRSETIGRIDTKLKQSQAIDATNEILGTPKVKTEYGKKMLEMAPSGKNVSRAASFQKGASAVRAIGQESSSMRSAEEKPTKGPEKWVLDGIDKLNQAGITKDQLETLKGTKQGRDLLIEASDASPNSKRMESILKRVRSASKGDE